MRVTAGVAEDNIWLDPGIGFARNHGAKYMDDARASPNFGYGLSGSSWNFAEIADRQCLGLPVEERMEGTGATVCYGIEHGCHIMRVHDVKEIARMAKMMDVLTEGKVAVIVEE